MRQIIQSMVALMVLVSSAIPACAMQARGSEANDSLSVQQPAAVAGRTITGTVYDAATNTPIPGVRVQGTGHFKVTAMTDSVGKYKIEVPSYVTLLSYSTPEYRMVQRPVLNDDVINVRLYSDIFADDYSDDIEITAADELVMGISPSITIDSDIQNKLGAKVRSVTRSDVPGIGNFMLIRGINSINAKTQPLVVVDGIILDTQDKYESLHMGSFNNILAGIDISDIDKVEVLTNGAAIYGARAANGVIKITTKRGKSMATRITANIYANVTLMPQTPDLMNAEQYRTYANELIGTMNTNKKNFDFLRADPKYPYYNKYHNETDWADLVYTEAFTQNYKVNVEGGDDIAMYNFSLGYTSGESTLEKNSFDRLNIRFNSDISLAKNLDARFDISYSRITREMFDDGIMEDHDVFPYASPGFLAMIKAPFLSPYAFAKNGEITNIFDESDSFAWGIDDNVDYGKDNNSYYNPMTILGVGSGDNLNEQEYTVLGITFAPELTLGDFKLTETFHYSLHRMSEKYYLPYSTTNTTRQFYAENQGRIGNFLASSFGKQNLISSDTRLSWAKVMKAHNLNVMGGFRMTRFDFDSSYLSGANSGNDKKNNISKDLAYLKSDGDDNTFTNLAWYVNADYSYKTRYFLQLAASLETSSRFGKEADGGIAAGGVKWGLFPSVQAAWLVSSEKWFNVRPINSLKLRAGYDITGNDDIDFYACQSYMQAVKFQDNYLGVQLGNVENETVKWETTSRINLGVDAMLFNNRLAVSFDWYKSTTKDLLVPKTYDYVAGMGTYWGNGGELQNVGFEASVTAKLINTRNFKWELGVTAGHYENEVTALDEDMAPVSIYGGEVLIRKGQPIGAFWGYKTDGILNSTEEAEEAGLFERDAAGRPVDFKPGDVRFVDLAGNTPGEISAEDKTVIGDPNPDLYGNIFSRMNYKNWTLDIGLNYSLGNDVYNYYRSQLEGGSNFFNQTTAMLNRWTMDGQNTNVPRAIYGDPRGNNRFSDRWIEDGSYLRLKLVQLSYNIPLSLSWLQGVTVWCAGENLLTFSKYLGNDPEFSANNNILYQGIDVGLVPQSRRFHLGIKVNL